MQITMRYNLWQEFILIKWSRRPANQYCPSCSKLCPDDFTLAISLHVLIKVKFTDSISIQPTCYELGQGLTFRKNLGARYCP